MAKLKLEGQRFGRLVVVSEAPVKNQQSMWLCQCDCGEEIVARGNSLRYGHPQSCGCLQREKMALRLTRHGRCYTKEYRAYINAKSRCENPRATHFESYGGRGIEFRFSCFEDFYAELGDRPTPTHSVDRINVDGHYERGNVRWAVKRVQQYNRRPQSEHPGVSKRGNKWRAYRIVDGKQKHLGYFNTIEEAMAARDSQ